MSALTDLPWTDFTAPTGPPWTVTVSAAPLNTGDAVIDMTCSCGRAMDYGLGELIDRVTLDELNTAAAAHLASHDSG
jgi:hypothetical protein